MVGMAVAGAGHIVLASCPGLARLVAMSGSLSDVPGSCVTRSQGLGADASGWLMWWPWKARAWAVLAWPGLLLPLLDLGTSRWIQWGTMMLFDMVGERGLLVV